MSPLHPAAVAVCAVVVICCAWRVDAAGPGTGSDVNFFAQRLLERYGGADALLSVEQVDDLLDKVRELIVSGAQKSAPGEGSGCSHMDAACMQTKCLSTAELFEFYDLPPGGVNASQVMTLVTGIMYEMQNELCYANGTGDGRTTNEVRGKPSPIEVWGYSFLSVSIINVCPILGLFFYPLMKTRIYRKVLMCTIGFAVGALSGTAIMVLIPEGFDLLNEDSHVKDSFHWKAVMVIVGIYVFFNIERMLGIIFQHRERQLARKERMKGKANTGFEGDLPVPIEPDIEQHHGHSHSMVPPAKITKKWAPAHKVKPVAWMIIIGDSLHNFMDGLSIGSAFTKTPLAGLGISLAIFSEELPHELGDFAVLLNAGMSLRQAATMNFVSAISCYLGMIAGVQIGNIDGGATWVFALTGGMFLYISLVEMLPEMNEQAKEEEDLTGHVALVYFIQNIGLVSGWTIIFLVAYYGGSFPS